MGLTRAQIEIYFNPLFEQKPLETSGCRADSSDDDENGQALREAAVSSDWVLEKKGVFGENSIQ